MVACRGPYQPVPYTPLRLAAVCLALVGAPADLRAADGILIRLGPSGLAVETVDEARLGAPVINRGLLVWNDDVGEHWAVVKPGWTPPPAKPVASAGLSALSSVRGERGSGGGVPYGQLTTQLDQLRGTVIARDPDADFLTPPREGTVLSGRPTFRRQPRAQGPAFPAVEAELQGTVGGQVLKVRIPFAANQTLVKFADLPGLPPALAEGLPPGEYRLTYPGGLGPKSFQVEPVAERERVLGPIRHFELLAGPKGRVLGVLFGLEHLLQETADGQPLYLADALDLIDGLPEELWTAHLRRQRERLVQWLTTAPSERRNVIQTAAVPGVATGVAEIDEARQRIAAGQWRRALTSLGKKTLQARADGDSRVRGLMLLYRAVVEAEGGVGRHEDTTRLFDEAQAALAPAPALDRFRAADNYADYLQGLAVDRLYNHAFQLATGTPQPFLRTLQYWLAARAQYEEALRLAEGLDQPAELAAVRLNLARLHSLLADVIRTLDPGREFLDGEQAAARQADRYLAAVLDIRAPGLALRLSQAQAAELRAQLRLRAGDLPAARQLAHSAMQLYLDEGYLVGVENVERLLALTADSRPEALGHYRIAHALADALRSRLPLDRIGLTRAGFLARKAWVTDKIVELLLQENRPVEALGYLEQARARGLQDLLLAAQGTAGEAAAEADLLPALLANWRSSTPDVAALVYFLGEEQAWVFVINCQGQVKAHPLRQADGTAVRPRALIGRVQQFLRGMEASNQRILDRLLAGRGYDHGWEQELHELYQQLIPAAALPELRQAKTVLLVPQHILHYFPFAALVTARDPEPRGSTTMVRPRFLLDEPFALIHEPALTAWALLRRQPARPVREARAVGIVEAPGAEPLPGVATDLKNFTRIFGGRVRQVVEGEAATESRVKGLLAEPGLLLLATHGLNLADRPLDSHLLALADNRKGAAAENDGRLTAGEIFASRVKTDLVVMSACYSGLGDRSPLPGDDLFGLQRAVLQAGGRTVVSGLWDVFDGTAPELMAEFFDRLHQGAPAARALSESQRRFLEKRRAPGAREAYFLHPYFWAVYLCAGDDRTAMER